MFKKLRNRFLILNLVIISIMMLISFASVYLITYKIVRTDINMELHRLSGIYRRPNVNIIQPGLNFNYSQPAQSAIFKPSSERSVSFCLFTDKQWNISTVSSVFDMDSSFFENAKKAALSQNKNTGNFKLDETHWAFKSMTTTNGNVLVFLDISPQQGILTKLTYTFLTVTSIMLIIIYFISKFFANKSIKPVKEAFEKQKQFIADASHELKTPLAVINTNVDALLANGEDTINNQSKWLHYIKSESERMAKLTNHLLHLTQMDYSDIEMIFTDFNLSETVENAILTMEAVIFEHNISLNYNIEPDLIAHGNNEQIREVVMILLDNALKYTDAKGSVDVALEKHYNNIVLTVANTGKGISEEHLGRIFDRFYRADKSRTRKYGGYGLGLAIAKTIVEHHKGKIYAKSILNENTTFYVELPIASS